MNMSKHLIWMAIGFITLLAISKFVGLSAFLLFFFLCCFMMAAMMLGRGHGNEHK